MPPRSLAPFARDKRAARQKRRGNDGQAPGRWKRDLGKMPQGPRRVENARLPPGRRRYKMSRLKPRPTKQAQRCRPDPSLLSLGTSGRRYKSGVGMTAKRRVDGSGTWERSPGPATRGECQAAAWKAALQNRCAIMRSRRVDARSRRICPCRQGGANQKSRWV